MINDTQLREWISREIDQHPNIKRTDAEIAAVKKRIDLLETQLLRVRREINLRKGAVSVRNNPNDNPT